jgi:hypothetical protein
VGDRPVHKLPFVPKCRELFVILYFASKNKPNVLPKWRLEETGNKFDVIMVNLNENVILYNYSFCIRSILGYIDQTEVYRLRRLYRPNRSISTEDVYRPNRSISTEDVYRPNRSISTEDVVRGRYTSVGRYKPRIDLIQKLQLLYY